MQRLVVFPQLQAEGLALLQIALGIAQQLSQIGTAMVAGDRFMQAPPDRLYRVVLGAPRWQRMQTEPFPTGGHALPHPLARVAAVVVQCQMQAPMAPVGAALFGQQLQEQLTVLARPHHPMQLTGQLVERARDPQLAVGARGEQGLLLPTSHPGKAHFGVEVQAGLVLEEEAFGPGQLPQHRQDVPQPLPFLFGVLWRSHRSRATPAEAQTMQGAGDRLAAEGQPAFSPKLQGQERAGSPRAQEAVWQGQLLFHQPLQALLSGRIRSRCRAAWLLIGEGSFPGLSEAPGDGIDRGARTVQHPGDLAGTVSIDAEGDDVHAQAAAGLGFPFHLADEDLALLGCQSDTGHGWLPPPRLTVGDDPSCHDARPPVQSSCAPI